MKFHSKCDHCGHRIAAYTQPMNAGLARAFLKLCDARIRLKGPVKKAALVLDHSQYGNFQKLRHFGLAILTDDEVWDVTVLGWEWFKGERAIASPCAYMGNEALPPDHLAWSTHRGKRVFVTLADVLPQEWKDRNEFRLEASG